MTRNEQGMFEPTLSAITYGPVVACDTTDALDFEYKLVHENTYSTAPLSDALIDLLGDLDYQDFDAPVPPSGP